VGGDRKKDGRMKKVQKGKDGGKMSQKIIFYFSFIYTISLI
jgi:hypothetical protein